MNEHINKNKKTMVVLFKNIENVDYNSNELGSEILPVKTYEEIKSEFDNLFINNSENKSKETDHLINKYHE